MAGALTGVIGFELASSIFGLVILGVTVLWTVVFWREMFSGPWWSKTVLGADLMTQEDGKDADAEHGGGCF